MIPVFDKSSPPLYVDTSPTSNSYDDFLFPLNRETNHINLGWREVGVFPWYFL